MRAVVQRVASASVRVEGEVVGSCGRGLLLLVGVHKDDTEAEAAKLAEKIAGLRIFNDEEGKMNRSLVDLQLGVLVISNFTVYGDTRRGNRPSFAASAGYADARYLFERFLGLLATRVESVSTGVFGADMKVELENEGPVTLVVEVGPFAPGPEGR